MKTHRVVWTVAAAATALALPGLAAADQPSAANGNASIPFANHGGIYDWVADGNRGIYIQSIDRKWYYAKLLAPCIDLPFAERVGFVTEPGSGTFDKFSSILVRGQECPVVSLTPSGPPDPKQKHWRDSHGGAGNGAKTPPATGSGSN